MHSKPTFPIVQTIDKNLQLARFFIQKHKVFCILEVRQFPVFFAINNANILPREWSYLYDLCDHKPEDKR